MPRVTWEPRANEGLKILEDFSNSQRATLREQIINWAGGAGWNVGDEKTRSFKISYQVVHARAKRTAANETKILNVEAD